MSGLGCVGNGLYVRTGERRTRLRLVPVAQPRAAAEPKRPPWTRLDDGSYVLDCGARLHRVEKIWFITFHGRSVRLGRRATFVTAARALAAFACVGAVSR